MAKEIKLGINTADMVEALFGIKTTERENPVTATVGLTAARILTNNPRRVSFTLFNLSVNTIYLSLTAAVAATRGFRIAPNGGSLIVAYDRDFTLVCREWYAIATGANSAIYTLENYII